MEIDNVPTQQLLEVETAVGEQVWELTTCERNEKREINNKNKILVDISYYCYLIYIIIFNKNKLEIRNNKFNANLEKNVLTIIIIILIIK